MNKILMILLMSAFVVACSPARLLNKIPIHSVSFKVVDQNGDPVAGAVVEASNGKSSSTNNAGMASLRFGSLGIHSITVMANNYMPDTMTISLPADGDKTITARLTTQATYTGNLVQMPTAQLYPMLFTYLFNSFGYNMELTDYEPGEWTKWKLMTDSDDAMVLKKAFLKETNDGQQWWQIQLFEDGSGNATYTAEVLFDQNKSSIRRYREKIEGSAAQEKPVTENWYSQPTRLTPESIEGAVEQKNVRVNVPKGTFTADLINFGVAPEIALKIWRVEEVPGGTVQYATERKNETVYESQLINYGSDASTVLNSY